MKFTLVSDLHIDNYPDNQQIDWHVVHRWARADILVIAGNVSDSFHCTIEEILLARQAFRHVVFVDGPCEHYSDYGAPHASDELQRFAEQHDGERFKAWCAECSIPRVPKTRRPSINTTC